MDNTKHRLDITWGKAFDEIYCSHASLFIPFVQESLFDTPELVRIGITVRYNTVKGRKIVSTFCRDFQYYLPCNQTEGGLIVKMNSSTLIDAIGLNSWTVLKYKKRGTQKEFPTRVFYTIGERGLVELPFTANETPYLSAEEILSTLKEGEKIDTSIYFNL